MSTTLRVAFASAVRHATDYLRILGGDERVELVGVVEEAGAPGWVREDSRAVAESVGLPYAEVADVASAAEALGSAVDLVVVCAEPTRHARLAAGLLEAGLDVLAGGLAANRILDLKRETMIAREFQPGFRIDLHHKDMGIALDAARAADVALPVTNQIAALVAAARAQGYGSLDHSALLKVIENFAGRA